MGLLDIEDKYPDNNFWLEREGLSIYIDPAFGYGVVQNICIGTYPAQRRDGEM